MTLPGSTFPATRREFLAELRASDRAFRAIQARRFELLAQVDVLWSAASGEGPVVPGLEQLVPAGSDGTPLVAEFASLELAAAMHLRPEAIDMELSLATDCLHRLPYAWAAVMAGSSGRSARLTIDMDAERWRSPSISNVRLPCAA